MQPLVAKFSRESRNASFRSPCLTIRILRT
jgi:hypothetical protein